VRRVQRVNERKPYTAPAILDRPMCTACVAHSKPVPALNVATAADGLQWFECGAHDATDNVAGAVRVESEPLESWRARAALRRQLEGPQFALNAAVFGIVSDIAAGKEVAPLELTLRTLPAVLGLIAPLAPVRVEQPCIWCTAEPVVSCVDSRWTYCALHWVKLCRGT